MVPPGFEEDAAFHATDSYGDSVASFVTFLQRLGISTAHVIQFVFANLAAERVAVHSENFRGTALVPLGAFQDAFDEFLLEFRDSFFKKDATFDH
jgi:hypothetical protein